MKQKLVILEMANNHGGSVNHGIEIINSFYETIKSKPFRFAFKFQMRDIDSFIHPLYKDRNDIKYVRRFKETKLSLSDMKRLKTFAEDKGFLTICTPFDERSVDAVLELDFDMVKIASCSLTDWPLISYMEKVNKPIIASVAGSPVESIDKVVSFFKHRDKDLSILHCVGEYPTREENLNLGQIDLLKSLYPDIPIGFSTHEHPSETLAVQLAYAKGAEIFEKHVGIDSKEYPLNAYSVTPIEFEKWLLALEDAIERCGSSTERMDFSKNELQDLRKFKRGVFVKESLKNDDMINRKNTYLAWPAADSQVLAENMSKYTYYILKSPIEKDSPVILHNVQEHNDREQIWEIVKKVRNFIQSANVVFPGKSTLEISHHYGLNNFNKYGLTMVTVINRDYCKKLIILFPGQSHPEQYHQKKEETFMVLHGELSLSLDGKVTDLKKGDIKTIEPNVKHAFTTTTGCILEELSTTHFSNDSFYTDENITNNKSRKTIVNHWIR